MEFPTALGAVDGAKDLYIWFGYWPTFHDAEVIRIHLNRGDSSTLALHAWETSKEVNEEGFFVQKKHIVVEFVMNKVIGLRLSNFNHQNVISGLAIDKTGSSYRLTLEDCFGIAGTIDAEDISIRLIPGKPKDAS